MDHLTSRPFEQTETNFSLETSTLSFIATSRERAREGTELYGGKKMSYGRNEIQVPLRRSKEVVRTLIYGLELNLTKAA